MSMNLLPWRQTLYSQRLRRTLQALAVILALTALAVILTLKEFFTEHRLAEQRITLLQQQLSSAAARQQFMQQAYETRLTINQRLQARHTYWQQNADWQARMQEWGRLDNAVRISKVQWNGQQLQLSGESDDASTLRHLKHQALAQQEDHQIELATNGKYQFVISKQLSSEADGHHADR
jgi:Tfp pilus assembly protein PilN